MTAMAVAAWTLAVIVSGPDFANRWRDAMVPQPPVADAPAIMADAIDFMRTSAWHREQVDWPSVQAQALRRAGQHGRSQDLDAALAWAVQQLNDGHSFYLGVAAAQRVASAGAGSVDPATGEVNPAGPRFEDIATLTEDAPAAPLLTLHTFAWTDPALLAEAADHLRGLTLKASRAPACGLVVDLSENRGGSVWTLLQGLLPVIDGTHLGQFEDGVQVRDVTQREGAVRLGGQAMHRADPRGTPRSTLTPKAFPVALVTSGHTASAAELLLIAFQGQPLTRRFGQPTAGVHTANTPRRLAHGGVLAIATHVMRDRQGQLMTGPLGPDQTTSSRLEAQRQAQAWVQAQCPDAKRP